MSDIVQSPFNHHNALYNYSFFFGLITLSIIAALILFHGIKVSLRKSKVVSHKPLVARFKGVFVFMFILIAANTSLSVLELPIKIELVLVKVLYLLLIYAVTHFLIMVLKFIKLVLFYRFDVDLVHNLEERKARTQIDFLQKAGSIILIMIAFAIALMSFSRVRELGTSILASAGLAGIIIGLAAQKSISNLLAGLQIAFTQPIRIDDAVIVEDQFGKIEEISLTYVVVKIWNEKRLILPISYFIDKPFQNLTRNTAQMLDSVIIYADHTLPLDKIREEVSRVLHNEGSTLWDKRVSAVQLTDCSDSSIQIRILISAENSGMAFELRCLIREKIVEFIRKNHPECLPKHRIANDSDFRISEPKQTKEVM